MDVALREICRCNYIDLTNTVLSVHLRSVLSIEHSILIERPCKLKTYSGNNTNGFNTTHLLVVETCEIIADYATGASISWIKIELNWNSRNSMVL